MWKEIAGLNINKQKERKWDKEGRLKERKWNSNKGERTAFSKIHMKILFFLSFNWISFHILKGSELPH